MQQDKAKGSPVKRDPPKNKKAALKSCFKNLIIYYSKLLLLH